MYRADRLTSKESYLTLFTRSYEKFHTYLFGHNLTVHSDHKPLESIHLKHLTAALLHPQQMLLMLQPYDLVICYQPGKSTEITDTLSILSPEEKEAIPGINVEIHVIYPRLTKDMLQRVGDETAVHFELNALKEMILLTCSWPLTIPQVSALLKPYYPFHDKLAVEDGIAMKGHCIIPAVLQKEILTGFIPPRNQEDQTES